MNDPITRARKEWCEPRVEDALDCTLVFHRPPVSCPPEVVAALLDVLSEAKAEGCGTYCTICGGEREFTGIRTWTFKHNTYCKLVAAEAAITRALEQP